MINSERVNQKIPSLSQLKNNIYNIFTNINELERSVQDNTSSVVNVNRLKEQTDEILKLLENAPLEHYAKKLNKRKQARKRKKLRHKLMKTFLKGKDVLQKPLADLKEPVTGETNSSTSNVLKSAHLIRHAKSTDTKIHNRLQKHNDAQRFLRTFELLKMLHHKRSQETQSTKEFAEQLNDLRATWSKVLEDNAPQYRQEQHVEDQWNEVFFGPIEHSYYGGEPPKTSDFLDVRRTWDSYLTRSKQGSSIPCGWVLPIENAMSDWQQYRAT